LPGDLRDGAPLETRGRLALDAQTLLTGFVANGAPGRKSRRPVPWWSTFIGTDISRRATAES
jgi:hypothetical protein